MSKRSEIIERLENLAKHAVHRVGEPRFVMSLDDGIALHDAIALLKAQEPIEPIYELGIARCRCCNREIDKYDGVKYCPNCGQAVNWND